MKLAVIWDDPVVANMRRVIAVVGGGLLGWSLGGGYHLIHPGSDIGVIPAGIGFGLGLGLLVAACIRGEGS
jgi:hypothetical protein